MDVSEQEIPPEQWQALEALWRAVLGLEASIDASRLSLDGLRAEMEAAFKKSLAVEEKLHALQSDMAQWNKAKGRVHYALPKVREFVHRATWAVAVPERKRLEEIYRTHIEPRVPLPEVDKVREQLEHLQKDRQVLFAQGNSVYQECRSIIAEIQRALSTLQRNAADRARAKRSAGREKFKYRSPVPGSLGMCYVGILWLPFEDCRFQVNVEALEMGTTGMREATVMIIEGDKWPMEPQDKIPVITSEEELQELYRKARVRRLPSDDPRYDASFPQHPLSLVRARLARVIATTRLGPDAQGLRPHRVGGSGNRGGA